MKKSVTTYYFAELYLLRKFLYIVVPLCPVIFFAPKIFNACYSFESQLFIIIYIYMVALCATEDVLTRTIPDFYNVIIFISGISFSFDNKGFRNTVEILLKTTVLFAVLILLFFVVKDGIGGGDIKMIAASSAFIGTINALLAFCLASILAVPLCLFLIVYTRLQRYPNKSRQHLLSKKTKKTKQSISLPFGPFFAFCLLIQLNSLF